MSLFISEEFSEKLALAIPDASDSIIFMSAFTKRSALEWLKEYMQSPLDVTVIARWRKHDLLAGASDIDVYDFCQESGWRFGIDQNLHGKVYLIDESKIFLGSANLTKRGLSIGSQGNWEFGTVINPDAVDILKVKDYINQEVVWVNSELFEKLNNEIKNTDKTVTPTSDMNWSIEVTNRLKTPIKYLWVRDLLFTEPERLLHLDLSNEYVSHDYELLDLNIDNLNETQIGSAFKQSKIFNWLNNVLINNTKANFGLITHELHNSLLDDPKPYRKEVKEFVSNIFQWATFLSDTYKITKYNVTSSIELVER